MGNTIIKLDDIAKSFGNVRVIEHISFSIEEGKVYALAGENGAGKSTLCNIISGSLKPDEGSIYYNGKHYDHFTIQQAKEIGIKMVHQELQILPLMNVEENIFIGEEITLMDSPIKENAGADTGIIGYGASGSNSNDQGYGYRNCRKTAP